MTPSTVFWVAGLILLAIGGIWMTLGGSTTVATGSAPRDVLGSAAQLFTEQGWSTASQSDEAVTFTRRQPPTIIVAVFLLVLGIIPGVLYWRAFRQPLEVAVSARPAVDAPASQVQISWNRNRGGLPPSMALRRLLARNAPSASPSV